MPVALVVDEFGDVDGEYSFYLDCTPTHSYMKYLYKYPQATFPYDSLIAGNQRGGDHDRYFDVFVEYAKAHVKTC